jgi:hypothetical protein
MEKKFRMPAHEVKPIAVGMGSCTASDRITVDGAPVGFMYRETPDNAVDSGWRFFCGDESQEYADDPEHFAIYDVNTIANYDPTVIPLLDSPVMSAFERNVASGGWVPAPFLSESAS